MQRSTYSDDFKQQALSKVYQRQGRSIQFIADELNLPKQTLKGWIAIAKRQQPHAPALHAKRPEDWSMAAPFFPARSNGGCLGHNRTVRYDWLGQYLFDSIAEVQEYASDWIWTYNHERPIDLLFFEYIIRIRLDYTIKN